MFAGLVVAGRTHPDAAVPVKTILAIAAFQVADSVSRTPPNGAKPNTASSTTLPERRP